MMWIHLTKFGINLEGHEAGHPEHAGLVLAKHLISWSLIWVAEGCSRVAPLAAVVQVVVLVKESMVAADSDEKTLGSQSYELLHGTGLKP